MPKESEPQSKAELVSYNLVFRSLDCINVLDSDQIMNRFVIPDELRKLDLSIGRIMNDERTLFLHATVEKNDTKHEELYWINTSGNLLRHEQITFRQNLPSNKPRVESKYDWVRTFAFPIPGGILLSYNDFPETSNPPGPRQLLYDNWLPELALAIISAGLAWLCYRRQRRMALPWTWVWVGFVFIFGVPGFLAYLFHRRWPVLDNCHVCGHAVPHDREKCSSCGSEFPTPRPGGSRCLLRWVQDDFESRLRDNSHGQSLDHSPYSRCVSRTLHVLHEYRAMMRSIRLGEMRLSQHRILPLLIRDNFVPA